jgi:4-amino-4-deoxy-L-arabinose transferase-like glycosyltransferase
MRAPERLRTMMAEPTSKGSRRYLVLWVLILVALGLRLVQLTFQPLWWDEGWSLYFASANIGTLLERTAVDIHPPLYYLLLHLWIGLFGSSVVAVRLLSVLIGVATVPLIYLAGRWLMGEWGGLVAAFLLAISPFHIYYSQEVRMYGLVTLLGLGATYFALRWSAGPGGRRWWSWLGYVLAATAALYSQYYAATLLLALNLAVLIRWYRAPSSGGGDEGSRQRVRALLAWLAAQGVVAILYLPWLWYASGKLLTYVRFKVGVEGDVPLGFFTYVGRHLAAFTWGHAEGILAGWWWLGLLPLAILALASAAVVLGRRSRRLRDIGDWVVDGGTWMVGILVVTLVCGFVVNVVFPFNPPRSERLLLLALPAYLLLVTALLRSLWQHRRPLASLSLISFVVLAILSLGFFYTVPRYAGDDYRPVAERVRALGLPGDAIVCVHPWQVGYFQAYLPDDDARPSLVLTPREVLPRERQLWADDPALMAADLDALLAQHGRLWFPDHRSMGRVLESAIEAYLVDRAYPVLSEWYGENTVLSFFADGEPEPQPVRAQFGQWLDLEGAALSPGPLEAGWGILAVDLTWRLSEVPSEDYTVGLRLVGPEGHVWAQRDAPPSGGLEQFQEWPVGEPRGDRHGLLVPAGTPPGDYQVTLRVYQSEDVAVLPVAFAGGSGGEVALGAVRVVRPEVPPPVEALAIRQATGVDFDNRLRLLGYNLGSFGVVKPGETVEVALFWQALADPGEDFLPRLQLFGPDDETLAELTEKPVAGTYPTAWWRAGELVRDPHALPIAATVPPGYHRLALSLVRASSGQPVEFERGQTTVDLGEIEVVSREHRYEPTVPQHVQVAQFGTSVELVGYDVEENAGAPDLLHVTLYWHALETPDRNYRAFVHLLDAAGTIVTQHDGPPVEGQAPTLGWLPGEYLTDPHPLEIPVDLPTGIYRLGVGLYDPDTRQRLGDRVILDTPLEVIDDGMVIEQ